MHALPFKSPRKIPSSQLHDTLSALRIPATSSLGRRNAFLRNSKLARAAAALLGRRGPLFLKAGAFLPPLFSARSRKRKKRRKWSAGRNFLEGAHDDVCAWVPPPSLFLIHRACVVMILTHRRRRHQAPASSLQWRGGRQGGRIKADPRKKEGPVQTRK